MTSPFASVAPYQLSIDGFAAEHFRVHSLKGNETISEAWWFDVVVTAPAGDDVERGALAQRATLIFNVHEDARAFYGVVSSVRLAEVHAVDRVVQYVVRLVPRLWLLRRKTRSRIFQNMRVPDVVSSVLLEAGITTRWQLVRAYPQREYCTQYEETDYQFVRRILAEAGIYFYFFGGGPVSAAAFAADAAVGVAASVGSSVAGFVGGSAIGGLLGAAAQMAETLIPGDTVVGADDAPCYPPVGGDDAGALAASTAAAMAPAIGDVVGGALGVSGGIGGAALGAASAVAGTVIADLTEGARAVPALHFMANEVAKVTTYDKVTRFTLRNSVRSTGAAFRDYDPDRPMVRLQSVAVSTQPFPPSPFEIAAEAAAAAESAATAAGGLLGVVGRQETRKSEQPDGALGGRAGLFAMGLPLLCLGAVVGRGGALPSSFLGLAEPIALPLDGDHVGVMDDPIDEGGGAGRVGEHGGPVCKGEVGGEHEALLLVAPADDLEEQVSVPVVEGEIADLVEDEEADLRVVLQATIESAGGLLRAEVEQELRGGDEEDGVSLQDGLVRDVLRDHRLAEALWCDEHDVARLGEEVDRERALDDVALDLGRPAVVEVGHGLEATEMAVGEAALQTAAHAIFFFEIDEVLKELCGAPSLLGGEGDQVVELVAGRAQPHGAKSWTEVTHAGPPGRAWRACRSGRARGA
jgi:hypothetical protein